MAKQIVKKCKYRFMLPIEDQECIGLECEHYQRILGNNPQTGGPVEEYICSDLLSNILAIENSQQQRQTGAAVESFRNEMVSANEASQRVLLATAQRTPALIRGE